MADILRDIIARNRAGTAEAIPSVCSAHPDVLRASLLLAENLDRPIVIEATSNQVNQDGGYTGLTPSGFIRFVHDLAARAGVDRDRIIFGGDHLGPQVWRKGPVDQAMAKAQVMVADYVRAGFSKIHLDCSEGCMGEPAQVSDAVAAERAATLALACEGAVSDAGQLRYVIGTEVPPPGGARTDDHGQVVPTTPQSARETLAAHLAAFRFAGLESVWEKVVGLVVQPGVEFSPMAVHHLPVSRDPGLRAVMMDWPGLCLEAHSTDYQRAQAYPRLAELGFAIHKVGPALTFAYRQAIYALDHLRQLAGWGETEPVSAVMDRVMLAKPGYWQDHYRGGPDDLHLQRHFGLADRIRYYWPQPEADLAVRKLFAAFEGRDLPVSVLWQAFSPDVVDRAAALGHPGPANLVAASIQSALDPYFFGPSTDRARS